jgi:hypothetical protein
MGSIAEWFRSWKVVSWRSALVAAVALYALIGFFVVPRVAQNLIVDIAHERTGREVTVEEVRCNPFALSLTVRGFSMPDRPGSVLLSFDELYINAQASSLFRWAATLKELRVTNPYLGVRRFPDGGINLLELKDDIEARMPPDSKSDEGGLPRAILQHILLTGTAVDVEDLARDEPLQWNFGPSRFEMHDISTIPDKEGTNDFVIAMRHGGTIKANGKVVVEPLGLDGTIELENLNLENVWEAAQPFFKLDVVDGTAGGRLDYSVFLAEDGPHALIDNGDLHVTNIEVMAGRAGETVLKVAAFDSVGASIAWPEAAVGGREIVVTGAEVFQWRRDDGSFSWDALVPKETQETVVKTYKQVEEAFPWEIHLDRFAIDKARIRLEDRTFDEPLELTVENIDLEVTDIITEPGKQWELTASALLFGQAAAQASGFTSTVPFLLEADVSLADLDLGIFQPYADKAAPLQLYGGVLETNGHATVDPKGEGPKVAFAGDLTINGIDLRETVVDSQLLKWGSVVSTGIDATVSPMACTIDTIDIDSAGIEVVISEDGKINIIEVLAVMAERREAAAAEAGDSAEGEEETEMPPIAVGAVNLNGCSAAYTDRTISPPFTLAVDEVDGQIKNVSNTATGAAAIDIEGPVRSGGMVNIEGGMDLFDPKRLTDLAIDVRQADMPPASPMSVRYIGHPMETGTVDVDLDYEITNSQLVGTNRFVTQDLGLGDKVEGEGMVNLPFKLGVSLLTDKEGKITLEFPVEGNLDDPGFGLGKAVGSAATEIVGELIKSPFRLLGKLGGGSGEEDLGFVEFEAGSSVIESHAEEKLATLAAGADQRPELGLVVAGAWDPEGDAAALQAAALEATVAERQPEGSATTELLESLYLEAGESSAALDELRATHTSEGEEGFDETTYYRDLRDAVIAARPVDPAQLPVLADARAEAIRSTLIDGHGIDPARVRVVASVEIEEPSGDEWVRCRLDVDAPAGE